MAHPPKTAVAEGEREARSYLFIVLAPVTLIALSLSWFGFWLQPAIGDLARVGGLSERSVGWRGSLAGFAEDRVIRLEFEQVLQGAAAGSLLVLGDSFAYHAPGHSSWLNVLQLHTRVPLTVASGRDYSAVAGYLRSDGLRTEPPLAVVIETVERETSLRAAALWKGDACGRPPTPHPIALGAAPQTPASSTHFERRTSFESVEELFTRATVALRDRAFGRSEVLTLRLSRDDMFSSRDADLLTLFNVDVINHLAGSLPRSTVEDSRAAVRCGLRELVRAADDVVPVWFVVAPDKRTAYSKWIVEPLPVKALDVIAVGHEALAAGFVDLRAPLTAAIEAGLKDVYLPDDTHWGPAGHRIVGETVAGALLGSDR